MVWEGELVLLGEWGALVGALVPVMECEQVQELVRDHDGGDDVGLGLGWVLVLVGDHGDSVARSLALLLGGNGRSPGDEVAQLFHQKQ